MAQKFRSEYFWFGFRTLDHFARALSALRQPDVQLVRDLLVSLACALRREGHVADVPTGTALVRLPLVVNTVLSRKQFDEDGFTCKLKNSYFLLKLESHQQSMYRLFQQLIFADPTSVQDKTGVSSTLSAGRMWPTRCIWGTREHLKNWQYYKFWKN
jgi:hypothetical protein